MEVMTHNTQLLIATERERWLKLHLEHGMTIYELKRRSGFSRDTLHRWKRAYLSCGLEGLRECSRAHHSYPHQTPEDIVQRIRELRTTIPRYGAKKIAMRLEKRYGIVCHWQTEHKGKWLYQFTAIDCCTRWRFLKVYGEQSNRTAVGFLRELVVAAPFQIQGIKTDNGSIFTNYYTGYKKSADPSHPKIHVFDRTCQELGMVHYLIDPGKPAQNGKVERSHRTDREEFWNHVRFHTLRELKKKQSTYVDWYNNEREHLGIEGLTPMEKLEKCQI